MAVEHETGNHTSDASRPSNGVSSAERLSTDSWYDSMKAAASSLRASTQSGACILIWVATRIALAL